MWLYLSGLGLFNTFKLLELALLRRIIDRLVLISFQAVKDTVCVTLCFTASHELTTKALAQSANVSQTPVPLTLVVLIINSDGHRKGFSCFTN